MKPSLLCYALLEEVGIFGLYIFRRSFGLGLAKLWTRCAKVAIAVFVTVPAHEATFKGINSRPLVGPRPVVAGVLLHAELPALLPGLHTLHIRSVFSALVVDPFCLARISYGIY